MTFSQETRGSIPYMGTFVTTNQYIIFLCHVEYKSLTTPNIYIYADILFYNIISIYFFRVFIFPVRLFYRIYNIKKNIHDRKQKVYTVDSVDQFNLVNDGIYFVQI